MYLSVYGIINRIKSIINLPLPSLPLLLSLFHDALRQVVVHDLLMMIMIMMLLMTLLLL
jgi:hypothetical protein